MDGYGHFRQADKRKKEKDKIELEIDQLKASKAKTERLVDPATPEEISRYGVRPFLLKLKRWFK